MSKKIVYFNCCHWYLSPNNYCCWFHWTSHLWPHFDWSYRNHNWCRVHRLATSSNWSKVIWRMIATMTTPNWSIWPLNHICFVPIWRWTHHHPLLVRFPNQNCSMLKQPASVLIGHRLVIFAPAPAIDPWNSNLAKWWAEPIWQFCMRPANLSICNASHTQLQWWHCAICPPGNAEAPLSLLTGHPL